MRVLSSAAAAAALVGACGFFAQHADAHGAMVSPRSRNSFDFAFPNASTISPCTNVTGDACQNGQAAYWYSQARARAVLPFFEWWVFA